MTENRKTTVMLSSCLLGCPVRYDGGANALDDGHLEFLRSRFEVVHICPEVAGGLETPRVPAEIVPGTPGRAGEDQVRVVTREGDEVSGQFARGAQLALELCLKERVKAAVLKERSPSCGSTRIYDGSFSGRVIPGSGVTAALLKKHTIPVFSEENFEMFRRWADRFAEGGEAAEGTGDEKRSISSCFPESRS